MSNLSPVGAESLMPAAVPAVVAVFDFCTQ